jgi:hypothetical protein
VVPAVFYHGKTLVHETQFMQELIKPDRIGAESIISPWCRVSALRAGDGMTENAGRCTMDGRWREEHTITSCKKHQDKKTETRTSENTSGQPNPEKEDTFY